MQIYNIFLDKSDNILDKTISTHKRQIIFMQSYNTEITIISPSLYVDINDYVIVHLDNKIIRNYPKIMI